MKATQLLLVLVGGAIVRIYNGYYEKRMFSGLYFIIPSSKHTCMKM